jgi:perosamine synthetase
MIPVSEAQLGERELEYVTECVRTGWISSEGRFIPLFEQAWAEYCGRRHGVAVCNGLAALQVALAALDLQPGDEVIMPAFTIISCALAVLYTGGTPVLVDSDPVTCTLDPSQVAERITPRTRAIMAVHIYGHPADMDCLTGLAEKHGLALLEDAAECHGAEYLSGRAGDQRAWKRCGSFGTMSTFSFYANKLVTTGEGGMILTDDDALAHRLRSLRNLCFQTGRRFFHEELGHNFRMTNLQAALGFAQIERIDQIVARKRRMGERYTNLLCGIPHLHTPVVRPWARSVYWMYGVVLDEGTGMDAAEFAAALARVGIQTRPYFLGMHEQPVFRRRGWFAGEAFPVAERLARQGLYLPSGLTLTEAQMDEVNAGVRTILEA